MEPLTAATGRAATLELEFDDEIETRTLAIVPDGLADLYAGFLGEGTPLGRAIAGQPVGAVLPFQGGRVTIRQLRIDDQIIVRAKANAARRQAQVEQAEKEIAKANATLFALTVESKWGDYDPDGIDW
jgi:hypothetical protein